MRKNFSLEITGLDQIFNTRGIGKVRELKENHHKNTECKL